MDARARVVVLVLLMPACTAGGTEDASRPTRRGGDRPKFAVTSYNVHRIPPLNAARPKVLATVWGENVGGTAGVPECFLSYGVRGVARVPATEPVGEIEPGNHFTVEGTARFTRRLPAPLESEDAYCRARRR